MSNIDLFSEVKIPEQAVFSLTADGVYDMTDSVDGVGFDTVDMMSGFIYMNLLVSNGIQSFVLQHSDDNSTWEDIPAENLLGDTIENVDAMSSAVTGFGSQGFFGTKRYVGIQITASDYDVLKVTAGNTVTIGVALVKRINLAS